MMARLKQLNARNYKSVGLISEEFEHVIRYLNAAEYGNRTLAELLAQLVDTSTGNVTNPLQFREKDGYLEWRYADPTDAEAGWKQLIAVSELRGPAGAYAGEVHETLLYDRQDTVLVAGQTQVTYVHDAADQIIMYFNGLLTNPGDYTTDDVTDTVTYLGQVVDNDVMTLFKFTNSPGKTLTFEELTSVTGTTHNLPFVYADVAQVQVFKNGVLMRTPEGYSIDLVANQIIFTEALVSTDVITFLNVDYAIAAVAKGVMTEEGYVDPTNGLIRPDRISHRDDSIPQAAVVGLSAALTARPVMTDDSDPPVTPVDREMWFDPERKRLYVAYDGLLHSVAQTDIPPYGRDNANNFLAVASNGAALVWSSPDSVGFLYKDQIGQSNGIAGLDINGRIIAKQMPQNVDTAMLEFGLRGIVNEYPAPIQDTKLLYGRTLHITRIALRIQAGTATIRFAIGGTSLSEQFTVSAGPAISGTLDVVLAATTTPLAVDMQVLSATSDARDLKVTLTGTSRSIE